MQCIYIARLRENHNVNIYKRVIINFITTMSEFQSTTSRRSIIPDIAIAEKEKNWRGRGRGNQLPAYRPSRKRKPGQVSREFAAIRAISRERMR